ncbi:GNAT family N-acetyltransferase [Herbaspirillum sp. GCM10030257]|uniref:GNAT family N-acetyltransferase n=1 Tax=Herbaspirillum sp. GCM10030257 TaxID=3273393 RepID=UPI00361156B8
MTSNDISISLFENSIPHALEDELEKLYQNLYSTLAHHRTYGDLSSGVSIYVARRKNEPVAILLLRRDKDTVRVLNEQIRLDAQEVTRFANYIFTTFSSVNIILFHAVEAELKRVDFPCQHFSCTEDIVLELPSSTEAYRSKLGKSTRSYINRYQNKLRRDFPTLRHDVYTHEEIREEHVRAIIAMNRARMADKHRSSYIDDIEAERILNFARKFGMVSVVTIDGRVCAGTINFRIGDNYFLKVIAHDPAFNDYGLGTVCCYLTICECIARGGREYHFLWGRYEYKYRLLGVQRNLDHIALYRSRRYMVFNGRRALHNALLGNALQVRSWLLQRSRDKDQLGIAIKATIDTLHGAKAAVGAARALLARRPVRKS